MKPNMIIAIALLSVLALSACDVTTIHPEPDSSFSSPDELRDYLEAHSGSYYGGVMMNDAMLRNVAMDAAPTALMESAAGSDGISYTGTNNQETGVDEADILKTNGEFIYTIDGNGVSIIKSLPAEETERVGRIELNRTPSALFLEGTVLMVISQERRPDQLTVVQGFDVSDPQEPEEVFDTRIEGSYVTGRYTDRAYVVTQSMPDAYRPVPMPIIIEDGVRSNVAVDRIIMPRPVDDARFVTISAISTNGDPEPTSILTDGYPTVYASDRAIHLAVTRTINAWELRQEVTRRIVEPMLTNEERSLIERIEETDSDILSSSEKEAKIQQILGEHLYALEREAQADIQDRIETDVKDELASHDSFEYTDLIEVPYATLETSDPVEILGTVNNQFSLDEQDGVLRVATTTNPRWSLGEGTSDMENHVWTIDGEVLDHEDGLAMGERIFSARYLDDRLYLVTFRQVDPFFAIDLSDPEDIEVLGELKIPGFSRYLHSYSEDVIIGLGRDASETGRQRGLKISLFDVSDPERPRELTNWISDERYVSSSAEWEHKAFLLDRSNDLLVIPISGSYERIEPIMAERGLYREPQRTDGGALVFEITEDDIELRGFIEHDSYQGVERSLVIEDALYTKSADTLLVNAIDDLDTIGEIELEGYGNRIW